MPPLTEENEKMCEAKHSRETQLKSNAVDDY